MKTHIEIDEADNGWIVRRGSYTQKLLLFKTLKELLNWLKAELE